MIVRVDVAGQLEAKQRLALIGLPAAKRKRVLSLVGRKVRVSSRKRIRDQRDIQGRSWAPRKNTGEHGSAGKRKRSKKMLRGLSRLMITRPSAEKVDITFASPVVGKIAKAHQEGISEIMTAEKMRRLHGQPDYTANATRKQAKGLREEGFKIRRENGKGWKKPSLKWITENLSLGQAGAILRSMRDKKSKSSWEIPLSDRSFLGASDSEIKSLVNEIFDQTIRAKTKK